MCPPKFNFYFFFYTDDKLYYIGKNRKDRRLVILDEEGKKQVFEDCHGSTAVGEHGGQKKTLEKIESLFFWRGMVKDVVNWVNPDSNQVFKEILLKRYC